MRKKEARNVCILYNLYVILNLTKHINISKHGKKRDEILKGDSGIGSNHSKDAEP